MRRPAAPARRSACASLRTHSRRLRCRSLSADSAPPWARSRCSSPPAHFSSPPAAYRSERRGVDLLPLRAEQNELLTRTGPGTPLGELFRRYWLPALLASELPEADCPPVRVKLLSERLVAFRDSQNRLGL